jgi:RHS repeat-associated protein
MKNAAGHITRFEEYDVFGNLTRKVDPNGVVYETELDAMGRVIASTVKGIVGCDTATDALCGTDLTSTREYLDAGPLGVEQRPLGGVNVSAYDDRGRVRTVSRGPAENDLRERIEISYDPLTGRKSMERMLAYVSGSWTETRRESYAYDSDARLQTITHADGAAVHSTYDAADPVATVRDENHASANTMYAYDPAGRIASVRQVLAGAPNGQITTSYGYDIHGNLTSVTDPNGNATTYVYDDFGQMLSQQSPVSGTTTYVYDDAGNLKQVADANGAVTVRQYDVVNRVTSATSTREQTSEIVSWSYDDATAGRFAIGRLAGMTDPAGSVQYSYERRGMLRQETRTTPGGATYVQGYGYDADGNRNALVYPSGRVVSYQYDYAGRPLTATGTIGGQNTSYVTGAAYLPFGPLTSLGLGNGTVETRTFNARYLPATSSLTSGASTIAQYVYTNDPAGNITSITDGIDAGYSRFFGYDDLHRLIAANTGSSLWGAGAFTYDRMGNMLTATLGGRQRTFTHHGTTPRIGTATGLSGTMSYDDAGNELDSPAGEPALGGSTAVQYSPRNLVQGQLLRTYDRCFEEHGSACTQPDPAEDWQTNVYDGRGVRVLSSKVVVAGSIGLDPPLTHVYFYSPELAMLNVVSHSTGRTADVIWFGSRPVADHSDTEVRYTYTDHLGTPILQTTASATVSWRVEYEPYGTVYALRSGAARDDQPLRFPGQQVAYGTSGGEESYNIFRWYRSAWGRYSSADPIADLAIAQAVGGGVDTTDFAAFIGYMKPYLYAGANPITLDDPNGLGRIPGFGKFRIDKSCKQKDCDPLRILPEKDEPDGSKKLRNGPKPGGSINADAVYWPGNVVKIPDNCNVTMICRPSGNFLRRNCLDTFEQRPEWFRQDEGDQLPSGWPGYF